MRRIVLAAVCGLMCTTAAAPAEAKRVKEPKLTVSTAKLRAALTCTPGIDDATRTPVMLVTGTGASGTEAYAIGKPALDTYGAPVCYVDFPDNTTADVQVSVQYLVYGLRRMHQRAGRDVAVIGISQGGLLPRIALTYWPSLRSKVSDVLTAAATHHGSTGGRGCGTTTPSCIPAAWQQAAGSNFLKALNRKGRDETPGPTDWTTTRSSTDETVQPQTGPRPTSALRGASNVLIQDICPGREVSHIGTILDSVTFALFADAVANDGPGRASRLPADVCAQPYAPGLDPATTSTLLGGAGGLTSSRYTEEPRVRREPKVRPWVKRLTR